MICATLETPTEANTKREGYVVIAYTKPVPYLKTVVITRVGRDAKRVAATHPAVNQKASVGPLITDRGEQCTHLCESACAGGSRVVCVVAKYGLGTEVETIQGALCGVVAHEEFVAIAKGESEGFVVVFVVARANEAGAQLGTLFDGGEGSFVGEFCATAAP